MTFDWHTIHQVYDNVPGFHGNGLKWLPLYLRRKCQSASTTE